MTCLQQRVTDYYTNYLSLRSSKPVANLKRTSSQTAACKFAVRMLLVSLTKSCRAIVDGRVGSELVKGYAITFEFATTEIIGVWPHLSLPNTQLHIDKVARMQSAKIRMNVRFDASA